MTTTQLKIKNEVLRFNAITSSPEAKLEVLEWLEEKFFQNGELLFQQLHSSLIHHWLYRKGSCIQFDGLELSEKSQIVRI
jgi:hypothetical protein